MHSLVDLPQASERLQILKLLLKEEKLADDVSLIKLAEKAKDYSGADLKNVCVVAALSAVEDYLKENPHDSSSPRILRNAHFEKVYIMTDPKLSFAISRSFLISLSPCLGL